MIESTSFNYSDFDNYINLMLSKNFRERVCVSDKKRVLELTGRFTSDDIGLIKDIYEGNNETLLAFGLEPTQSPHYAGASKQDLLFVCRTRPKEKFPWRFGYSRYVIQEANLSANYFFRCLNKFLLPAPETMLEPLTPYAIPTLTMHQPVLYDRYAYLFNLPAKDTKFAKNR